MGLIGNRHVAFRISARHIGGSIAVVPGAWSVTNRRSRTMSEAFEDQRIAYPVGYLHPYAFDMPLKPGGASTFNQVFGTGTITGTGVRGKNAEADLVGDGALAATGKLVVAAIAALTGEGSLSGSANATLAAVAALSGSGTLAGSIGALGGITAPLSGTGSCALAAYATGTLAGDITNEAAGLSVSQIVSGVWSATAAANNDTGTMGEKLNGAGSAGNPWTETIETGMTAAQAMRLITAALAGKISGAAGTTITIKNAVADDANRITATVDADGNRTAITYDLD